MLASMIVACASFYARDKVFDVFKDNFNGAGCSESHGRSTKLIAISEVRNIRIRVSLYILDFLFSVSCVTFVISSIAYAVFR